MDIPVPIKELLAYYRLIETKKVRLPLVGLDNNEFSVVLNSNVGLSENLDNNIEYIEVVNLNIDELRNVPVFQFSKYIDCNHYMSNNVVASDS